jgi:hypothetical protein
MTTKRTIAELAAYERELMAELAEVRVEISERAGQVDPPEAPPSSDTGAPVKVAQRSTQRPKK